MNKIVMKLAAFMFLSTVSASLFGQDVDKDILNWYNGKKPGMETEKAYKLVKKKKSETVIVAIIDSGIDIEHEDLKGKIWINEDEIPGNGIDDDNNGYIDDVYGWNFLGNPNGENANDIALEKTRIYAKLRPKYGVENVCLNSQEEIEEYELYLKVKEEVDSELEEAKQTLTYYKEQLPGMLQMVPMMVTQYIGKSDYTIEDLKKWKVKPGSQEEQIKRLAEMILDGSLEEQIKKGSEHFETQINVHLNVDFDGRAIVGDNPDDFTDLKYGNGDVEGPDAFHGTHVGGIVGAVRGNDIGGDGVADNVRLMSLRAVPNGDEYDKDIALAIRYAVDNGAQVINMSFGKSYSPHAEEVYNAFAYADSKGVLLVHAAGNDNKNIDEEPNFPTSMYEFQSKKLDHFLTIGASTRYLKDDELAASFSNYGKEGVDVFAPGLEIYNTVPQSDYAAIQGTSMACPMVAGAAAFLKSYFPTMSMMEIKDVLLRSSTSYNGQLMVKPGGETMDPALKSDMIDFGNLSVYGGVINLKNAVKVCLEMEKAK
jgi:cell wall-associated protease